MHNEFFDSEYVSELFVLTHQKFYKFLQIIPKSIKSYPVKPEYVSFKIPYGTVYPNVVIKLETWRESCSQNNFKVCMVFHHVSTKSLKPNKQRGILKSFKSKESSNDHYKGGAEPSLLPEWKTFLTRRQHKINHKMHHFPSVLPFHLKFEI